MRPFTKLALGLVLLVAAHEALAQLMLGRPIMAQLLAPSITALPALSVVAVTLAARVFLLVVAPAAATFLIVGRLAAQRRPAGSTASSSVAASTSSRENGRRA